MDFNSSEAGKNCRQRFVKGEYGADCDLAEWLTERVCDLTC